MCVVSMVMDHYRDKWEPRLPQPWEQPYTASLITPAPVDWEKVAELMKPKPPAITPEEIAEFRQLLERAREYDKRNNEPRCEMDEKRQALLTIARALGVELSFL